MTFPKQELIQRKTLIASYFLCVWSLTLVMGWYGLQKELTDLIVIPSVTLKTAPRIVPIAQAVENTVPVKK